MAVSANTLNNEDRPAFVSGTTDFAGKVQCSYSVEGVVCKVPPGPLLHDG